MIVCTYILFSFHTSSGEGVVHSYGRLIYEERVITDKQQLQPPNNDSGDGRIECTVSSGSTRFIYYGHVVSTDSTQDIHQIRSRNKATAVIRASAFNNFVNTEGYCSNSMTPYHYLFLSNGENHTYNYVHTYIICT